MAGTSRQEYAQRVKYIRRYFDLSDLGIDLRRELTPSQKRMVTILHDQIYEANFFSAKEFSGKNETIQEIADISGLNIPKSRLKKMKRVPVPTRYKDGKVKVKKRKIKKVVDGKEVTETIKEIEISTPQNREIFIKLNNKNMVVDAEAELTRKIGNRLVGDGGLYQTANYAVFAFFQADDFSSIEEGVALFYSRYVKIYPIDKFDCLTGVRLRYIDAIDSELDLPTNSRRKKKPKNTRQKRTRKKSKK